MAHCRLAMPPGVKMNWWRWGPPTWQSSGRFSGEGSRSLGWQNICWKMRFADLCTSVNPWLRAAHTKPAYKNEGQARIASRGRSTGQPICSRAKQICWPDNFRKILSLFKAYKIAVKNYVGRSFELCFLGPRDSQGFTEVVIAAD